MPLITGPILKQVVPTLTSARAETLAAIINEVCPKYEINTADRLHEFIANAAHESGAFRLKEENLNYSAERLMAVWPSRFKTMDVARYYARNPRRLGNNVYGDRMGNVAYNDGYDNRGSGFMMITGRSMAEAYAKYKKMDVATVMNLCRTSDHMAMDSACWVWAVVKQLNPYADRDDMEACVMRINGGKIGLKDRLYYYERAKRYII